MMKGKYIRKPETPDYAGISYCCILLAAGLIFAFMSFRGYVQSYYEHFLIIPHMHNAWLQCFMGMGIAGFLMAMLFTIRALWNSLVILLRHHRDVWKRNVALLTLCLMAASFVESYLFYTTVSYHLPDFLFFLCTGYLVQWQEEDNRRMRVWIRRRIPFAKK